MPDTTDKSGRSMIEWSTLLVALGGLGLGGGAIGLQQAAPVPMVTRADVAVVVAAAVATKADKDALDTLVDQKDLDRLERAVDKLTDSVVELTIEVRSRRARQ
ncbi:MAG: hypothetical protein V3S01_02810 [Dehalococcoidia bacterium]